MTDVGTMGVAVILDLPPGWFVGTWRGGGWGACAVPIVADVT